MPDPYEGVAPNGTIRTGARRDRIPPQFAPVVQEAIASVTTEDQSLYIYGSVATGTATPGLSDIDLLSINLPTSPQLAERLTLKYADLVQGVEIAATTTASFDDETDQAYGNRVFLRHYCGHLTGLDRALDLPAFPADVRAARGFNGDIGQHLQRWRAALESSELNLTDLATRTARKTLLAVAGMVSIHDSTWTTDRSAAARRWTEVDPQLTSGLAMLNAWVTGKVAATRRDGTAALGPSGVVPSVVARFGDLIGLWPEPRTSRCRPSGATERRSD